MLLSICDKDDERRKEAQLKLALNVLNTTTSTNLIGALEFVNQHATEIATKLFVQTWLSVCSLQTSRYHLLKTLQNTNPTAVAKALLQRENIIAQAAGDGILQVWECKIVSNYQYRQLDGCRAGIPITYTLDNHTYDAFIDPSTRTITFADNKISCSKAIAQYFISVKFDQLLLWNGQILTPTAVKPHTIDLTLPVPSVNTIYLSQGKIDDPQYEAIESLARAQQTTQTINSVIQLLNAQLTGVQDGVDGRTLSDAAEQAGVNTQNFFKSLAHKMADTFVPSPWTLIGILVTSIILLTLLIIVVRRCSTPRDSNNSKPTIIQSPVPSRQQILRELRALTDERD
jgi:hypothetical protein